LNSGIRTAQNHHDFQKSGMLHADHAVMDRAIFAALKLGGVFVVIDHAAAPGSGTRDSPVRSDTRAKGAALMRTGGF
jgi:predicted methyltransferase